MQAVGIDLGGTKIEAQVFSEDWSVIDRRRVATPQTYPDLLNAVRDIIDWAVSLAGRDMAVGISAAGLLNPAEGTVLAANLAASGHPFPIDLNRQIGREVTYVNDSRALALSEAVFGAGRRYGKVLGVVLGTGVSGGLVIDGQLQVGPTNTAGEFGHIAAPAHLVQEFGLPIIDCQCGRRGCIETLISGAGMSRIAAHVAGMKVTPPELVNARNTDPMAQRSWDIWCALIGDLLRALTVITDPDCIVLGGGLSQIAGVGDDVYLAAKAAQFADFDIPPILIAEAGDASGAKGAAYAAIQALA